MSIMTRSGLGGQSMWPFSILNILQWHIEQLIWAQKGHSLFLKPVVSLEAWKHLSSHCITKPGYDQCQTAEWVGGTSTVHQIAEKQALV